LPCTTRSLAVPALPIFNLIEGAAHIAMIAIQRDRSQRALQHAYEEIKESEEKLRQDERELRQLIDFFPQHVFVLDSDGRLLQANQMVLDYTGHTLEEMQEVGTDERLRRDLHPDDLERMRSERQRGLSSGIPFEIEKRVHGKDGRVRWFLFRYKPLLDEEGRIARWFTTATDIEDRKQA
jgi:formate hydrogenlyase transcriptional activator